MFLNASIPRFHCFFRKEFLYNQQSHKNEFIKCCVFGVSSISGRALGFHVLLDNGAVIWRVPISALASSKDAPIIDHDILRLWNNFSYEVSVTEFDHLKELRCKTFLRNGNSYLGSYMFTIDWCNSPDSEDAGDDGHKCAHIIKLDNGCYAAQPNNRIQWYYPSFVTPFTQKPDYQTVNRTWRCENGDKWVTENSNKMFYEVESA